MAGKEHHLKTHPRPFWAVHSRMKRYEVRKNDRGFEIGDELVLEEYEEETKKYIGNTIRCAVVYMTEGGQYGLPADLVVMGIEIISAYTPEVIG
jgi:hypothetical protein